MSKTSAHHDLYAALLWTALALLQVALLLFLDVGLVSKATNVVAFAFAALAARFFWHGYRSARARSAAPFEEGPR